MFTESPFQVCWYHAGWLESGTRGTHRLLGCHCRIGGLSKSEWSIGISIERAGFNRSLLEKSAQNRFQNDALAVDQRTGHRCLTSQGALGHTRRTVGSRGALLDSRTEIAWLLKSCKEKLGAGLPIDLSFATKFLAVYLFIKVKGSRPMTYQYLTVEMVYKVKTNGGFIDQKMFKMVGKLGFDSLYLAETSMQLLDGYINHNRPLLRPTCDFVLVTRNGEQHNKLGELMSKLLFDATGKYVHSTRYRQIVETTSCRQLSGAPNDNFRKIICSEDDLRSRIFGSFSVKFLACLLLLGFSNIKKKV